MVAVAKTNGIPQSKILVFDNDVPGQTVPPGFKSWRTLFDHGEADWETFDNLDTSKNTIVARLFSSGTTGLPKAALLSHYNFIAQHHLAEEIVKRHYEVRQLIALPYFHIGVAPRMLFSPLRNGSTSYCMRRFALEPFLANIEKYGITDMLMVPPMVIAIIMSPLRTKYDLSSVKYAAAGAAPLGKEPQARLRELLKPQTPFTQV